MMGFSSFFYYYFSSGVQGRFPFSEIVPKNRTLNTFGAQILAELYFADEFSWLAKGGKSAGGVFFFLYFFICFLFVFASHYFRYK